MGGAGLGASPTSRLDWVGQGRAGQHSTFQTDWAYGQSVSKVPPSHVFRWPVNQSCKPLSAAV